MIFYPKSAKNHKIISQYYYKQKSKSFSMNINNWRRVDSMNNSYNNSIMKPLYLFGFYQALWFNFQNLVNCFRKIIINKTISSGINID